ncbi:hypothetical protein [Mesorhizobium amorphae]|uniref:hypothetical protein n=1 Tax=Mesorhizobium amorphae TaxID=71433 RepID=UPI0012EA2ECA|nr:hypothetical protein [Mesorhizobium amorphae]
MSLDDPAFESLEDQARWNEGFRRLTAIQLKLAQGNDRLRAADIIGLAHDLGLS